jgi:hypothetical protein
MYKDLYNNLKPTPASMIHPCFQAYTIAVSCQKKTLLITGFREDPKLFDQISNGASYGIDTLDCLVATCTYNHCQFSQFTQTRFL